jgi:hypothetical protein
MLKVLLAFVDNAKFEKFEDCSCCCVLEVAFMNVVILAQEVFCEVWERGSVLIVREEAPARLVSALMVLEDIREAPSMTTMAILTWCDTTKQKAKFDRQDILVSCNAQPYMRP